jgi:CubicO group peptidase (beta-lactamase class C family)
MARFEIAILKDELLRRSTRDLMFSSQKTSDGKATEYGLGWDLEMMGEVRVVRHTGAQQGTTTAIFLAPERNSGVVLLTNMDGLSAGPRAREMMSILLGLQSTPQ